MRIGFGYGDEPASAPSAGAPASGGLSTVVLAITGGGAGFLFGGPIGAVIGAIAGGVVGSKVKPADTGVPQLPGVPGAANAANAASAAGIAQAAADLRAAGAVPVSTDACLELCAKKAEQLLGALRVAQSQIDSLTAENDALRAKLGAAPASSEPPRPHPDTSAAWSAKQEQRARSAASKAVIDMCMESAESDREV